MTTASLFWRCRQGQGRTIQSTDAVLLECNDINVKTQEIHMPLPLLAFVPTILSSLASGASAVLAAGAAGATTATAASVATTVGAVAAAGAVTKAAVDSLGDNSEHPRLA